MKETGTLNELWSRLIIKELIHHGVRTFCIAPGSRSTPLTVAAANHPLAETIIHYDERGMAFNALGYSKGSLQPVALIVTSGSAVGNLLPAIMEAYHDNVPLIILTADRPPELRDTGANQATSQSKIFQNFVHWECDLPCPDRKIPQAYVGTTIAQGMSHALSEPRGPVHFNCMYRKPLLEMGDSSSLTFHQSNRSMHSAETRVSMGKPQVDEKTYEQIADELSEHEKGLILISGTEVFEECEKIYALSRLLQWPIFPDVLSSVRAEGRGSGVVPYFDLIIKAIGVNEDYAPDAILQLGDRFVSSKLTEWIATKKPKVHCHVASHMKRKDPIHSVTHRVTTDLKGFIEKLPNYLSGNPPSRWLEIWKELNLLFQKGVASYFNEHSLLSEPHLFHHLMTVSTPSTLFFFSNSMSIRNGDAFFCPEEPIGAIYGNRGLSGIDGNIATIAGIAKASKKPLIACIGDLAFLHDINSLPLLQNLPIKLVVINNNGGDIFSFLPISERKEVFKTYFTTPHNLSLKYAAALFEIEYENPQTISDFEKSLSLSGCAIIEVKTKAGGNKKIHREILTNLKEIQSRMETLT
ncbi:MAG: 2-succinyl-5-enolpyruvyl-6-hydroxy-3-cyclohexene-1-carboxylic-acid synthase [Simkaniaceae bacterium]|nr:MAG: 2-succinyl-5-enolpyruvyl-6-hydroxy-3-cyclohexene-1-carboxylic-acid synthase [Simkaniaceae bacterium]